MKEPRDIKRLSHDMWYVIPKGEASQLSAVLDSFSQAFKALAITHPDHCIEIEGQPVRLMIDHKYIWIVKTSIHYLYNTNQGSLNRKNLIKAFGDYLSQYSVYRHRHAYNDGLGTPMNYFETAVDGLAGYFNFDARAEGLDSDLDIAALYSLGNIATTLN